MMNISCPVCGSEDITESTEKRIIGLEFGRAIEIDETVYTCNDCDFDGDFNNENDKKIETALEQVKKDLSKTILDELSDNGITNVYFERAMGLPFRTLARWKKGNISASGYALLKTVKTYPWLLSVADDKFDHTAATKALLNAAVSAKHQQITKIDVAAVHGNNLTKVRATWTLKPIGIQTDSIEKTSHTSGLLQIWGQ
ncbi:MAG: hypothetical protein QM483_07345 [Desulfuromusa sp.]